MGDDHGVDVLGYATDNATQSEGTEELSVSDPESGGDGLYPGTSNQGEVLFTLYGGEGGRPPGHRFCADQAGKISWEVSLGIALDIANGLSYIHEDLPDQEQPVHFNLSPSSIFFSGDIAKIGSFERSEKLERDTARRIRVLARNLGYTAPEAVKDGVVSSKNDVYSFGVILLEMITGLKPADYDILLKGGIRTFVVDFFNSIVDSMAAPEPGRKGLRKSISLMVNTGLQCTENNPEDRPTMKEVVVRFKAITESGSKEENQDQDQDLQTCPSETISIHIRSSAGRSRSGLSGVQRRSSGGKLFKYFHPLCGLKDNQRTMSSRVWH
ncbi:hypothetical protein R1flu_026187 [Riccia fluitans]|uniref:non-specific serine/threonine protein kinase n=1 Tax=Riccia fluitans TaxID=41844 RepID=A0ABD1XF83_9MARC